jgi:alanine dehydrogenase
MRFVIGIPLEIKAGENRVSATPRAAAFLTAAGVEVRIQADAGRGSGFSNEEYSASGARVLRDSESVWDADLVVKVKEPLPEEYRHFSGRTSIFTYLHLAAVPSLARTLLEKKVTAIAYETVTKDGGLPLLRPMSEVAGILSVQAGARGLEKTNGGLGILLTPVTGGSAGRVCVIGAGTAGRNAVRAALGLGADVVAIDISHEKLERVRRESGGKARTRFSSPDAVEAECMSADLVVSTALVAGYRAPTLIGRALLRQMKPGAVVVDIAIDQGGTLESSRPTTHAQPFFVEEGIVHYCVANMPAAVPRTSTVALSAATLPWVEAIARRGVVRALLEDEALLSGLNTYRGAVTCEGVARALGLPYIPPGEALNPPLP